MSQYKVLQLPLWAYKEESLIRCVENKIEPIFNRYGLYINRYLKTCWLETKFGSYNYNHAYKNVLFDIDELNYKPLQNEVYNALKVLNTYKILYNDFQKLYNNESSYRYFKNQKQKIKKLKYNLLKRV